jgi:hypothetical protein
MRRKRKSNPHVDEAEDGGRAIAIEEGISALVFSYAARHDYLESVTRLDHELLTTIGSMVSHLEVSARRAADWEQAILVGFTAWRQLHGAGGQGALKLDLLSRTLEVMPANCLMAVNAGDASTASRARTARSQRIGIADLSGSAG